MTRPTPSWQTANGVFTAVFTANGIFTEGSDSGGYLRAGINGKKHYAHRFVSQAFLPPPPSEKHTQVTHIDGDPANNCADNLEWVTPLEIIQHPLDTNAERKSNAPKQSKPVLGRRHGSEEELPAEAGRRLRVQVGAAGGGPARQARRGVAGGAAVDIDCDRLR
jgi:hypothetical protein